MFHVKHWVLERVSVGLLCCAADEGVGAGMKEAAKREHSKVERWVQRTAERQGVGRHEEVERENGRNAEERARWSVRGGAWVGKEVSTGVVTLSVRCQGGHGGRHAERWNVE